MDQQLLKATRSLNLDRIRLFTRVVLPSSAPAIFTGVRLASGYAFIMLIASEMMSANSDLGYFVVQNQENYLMKEVFAGTLITTLLAVVTDGLIRYAEKRIIV